MSSADGSSQVVAVTGATGFLGSHVADALLAAGFGVRASVRPTSDLCWLRDKPVETIQLDLTDVDDCRRLLAGTCGLIHCAGVVSAANENDYQRGNVATTEALLDAASISWRDSADAPFILISSLAAHGPAPHSQPASESAPSHPITSYGRSKRSAERLVNDGRWSFRTVVLRPPSLYGPRDREFLPLLKLACRGWTVRVGRSLSGLSLVDGRDAAAAAVQALTVPAVRGTFFLDDGRTGYTWQELATALERATGRSIRSIQIPLAPLKLASRLLGTRLASRTLLLNPDRIRDLQASGWVCDGARFAATSGYTGFRDAGTGLSETLAFYREQGWL